VTYAEATAFTVRPAPLRMAPGLATIERLVALLDDPQPASRSSMSPAPTQGLHGRHAGRHLSGRGVPHGSVYLPALLSFTERIRVNGEPINEAEIVALTEELKKLCAAHFALETTAPTGDRCRTPRSSS